MELLEAPNMCWRRIIGTRKYKPGQYELQSRVSAPNDAEILWGPYLFIIVGFLSSFHLRSSSDLDDSQRKSSGAGCGSHVSPIYNTGFRF